MKIFSINTYAEALSKGRFSKRWKSRTMVWGLSFTFSSFDFFFAGSGVRGGGKCPEEEHTTCSGGRTINCHKRGLWGERK
jgi:hypothetical protein